MGMWEDFIKEMKLDGEEDKEVSHNSEEDDEENDSGDSTMTEEENEEDDYDDEPIPQISRIERWKEGMDALMYYLRVNPDIIKYILIPSVVVMSILSLIVGIFIGKKQKSK